MISQYGISRAVLIETIVMTQSSFEEITMLYTFIPDINFVINFLKIKKEKNITTKQIIEYFKYYALTPEYNSFYSGIGGHA